MLRSNDLIKLFICRQTVPARCRCVVRWASKALSGHVRTTSEPVITSQWVITPGLGSTGSWSLPVVLFQSSTRWITAINFYDYQLFFSLLLVIPFRCNFVSWAFDNTIIKKNIRTTDYCYQHMHDLKHLCMYSPRSEIIKQHPRTRAAVLQIYD